jgi:SAM-dependent methyltransferase
MTSRDIGTSYDAAADGWRAGPERMYRRLAEAMADLAPVQLVDAAVLDAGAGTGVAGDALRRRGAHSVVAVDLAPGMLPGPPTLSAVADLTRLPFRSESFDLAAAAFSLNHFTDPAAPMAELRRVAGALLATVFAPGWDHPAKEAVDEVMAGHGFVPPAWYADFKAGGAFDLDSGGFEAYARAAGFGTADAAVVEVDTGLGTPSDLVDWRLGMAHMAPYVADLTAGRLARARRDAERVVAGMPPLVVSMVVLRAS